MCIRDSFNLPAILLLLLVGFAAGPVSGLLRPDELFGDMLLPLVSISVAIILFEGGMSLHVKELREVGTVVRNMILFGVPVAWLLITLAARWILDFPWKVAVLLGAVLPQSVDFCIDSLELLGGRPLPR